MKIVSFYAPRPEHPFFQDYTPYLRLLKESCERYGHEHVCLTDDCEVLDAYVVPNLPRPLMKAFIAAQLAYLSDPANADVPTLLTGADCVLAQDPAVMIEISPLPDIIITTDDRFQDCRMNMGAMWIPRPAAVAHVWANALDAMDEEWGDDQRAVYAALKASTLRIGEWGCDPCNLAPEHPADDCRRGVVLHFRGPRKRWMADYCAHWLGIGTGVQIKMAPNTDDEVAAAQIAANLSRPYTLAPVCDPHDGTAILVGSGPSAADEVLLIQAFAKGGATIFGMNGSVRWLENHAIQPDFGMMLDMREGNRRFVERTAPRFGWLMASHCHPATIAAAETVQLYHYGVESLRRHLPAGAPMIGGGPTVGMTAMVMAAALGFRKLVLFGYDSSFRGDQRHLAPQPISEAEAIPMEVHFEGIAYQTNMGMYGQAQAFESVCRALMDQVPGIQIAVRGSGLLPAIAHSLLTEPAADAA